LEKKMKKFVLATCVGILAIGSANAQEFKKFTADIGGGFTTPVGGNGRYLDLGWNVGGGVGYNFSQHAGVKLNLGFNSMGINSSTLSSVGAPGGNVNMFSATIDPVVHVSPAASKVDFYLTGGGGLYHRYQNFTQPTVVTTAEFLPFFGFFPVQFGANQVIASYTETKPGFDVGAGMAIGAHGNGKFFMEAKWHHMFMNNGAHMDYIPVTFGFRF
jgi:hypothetical protein